MSLGSTAGIDPLAPTVGDSVNIQPSGENGPTPGVVISNGTYATTQDCLSGQKNLIQNYSKQFSKAFVDQDGKTVSREFVEQYQFYHVEWFGKAMNTYLEYKVDDNHAILLNYEAYDDSKHVIRSRCARLATTDYGHKEDVRDYTNTRFTNYPADNMPGRIIDWHVAYPGTATWIKIDVFIDNALLTDDELTDEEKRKFGRGEYADPNAPTPDDPELFSDKIATDWAEEYYSVYTDVTKAFSLQTFNYIIGLPCQFMEHVDTRWGDSAYGGDYVESILYDAPIATIIPGGPYLTVDDGDNGNALKKFVSLMAKGYAKALDINEHGLLEFAENEFTNYILGNKYKRFFTFSPDYSRYVQYVNTLCQLFIQYLGIQDRICPITNKPYSEYDDTIKNIDTDGGASFQQRYGRYQAIHVYYTPQSSLSSSTSNSTRQSQIMETLNSFSSMAKEAAFLAGAAGISKRSGVTLGETDQSGGFFTAAMGTSSGNALGAALQNVTASAETIFSGNNLQLPEIYNDSSNSGNTVTLDFTLASPYGDEESIFLHELRPLARIMALSYPRQFGPNGYTSPFICQCFAKGQFNVVLGIVEQLQIQRGGNGGEATTGAGDNIPLELNISLSIKDLYDQVVLSNMYELDSSKSQLESLVFTMNNVGLLNFTASFAGYNCNSPDYERKFEFLVNAAYDKAREVISVENIKDLSSWKFPKFSRWWKEQVDSEREKSTVWTR